MLVRPSGVDDGGLGLSLSEAVGLTPYQAVFLLASRDDITESDTIIRLNNTTAYQKQKDIEAAAQYRRDIRAYFEAQVEAEGKVK